MNSKLFRLIGGILILLVVLAGLYIGLRQLFANGQRLEAYTLPYVENFDDVDPKLWFSENGVWQIRNQALAQIANLNKTISNKGGAIKSEGDHSFTHNFF